MANSRVLVKPVSTGREKKQFLRLPWDLHSQDPNWVPPLRTNQKELVGYKPHPFYEVAEGQTFLAEKDGKVCGRILAIVDHAHIAEHSEKIGMFGFFESIDDQEVATGLFDAARDWLKERDLDAMRGPVNPSLNYECGLLIEGFDSPPTFMMTYNPPYYPQLFDEYGFKKSQDLLSFYGHVEMLKTQDEKMAWVIEEATRRFKMTTRRMDPKRFDEEIQTFLDIYNIALVGQWGHVPMSQSELRHAGASMKQLVVPELTSIAEVDGRPVAVAFGLLDYNPRIKKIDGKLFPFGFIRLLSNRRAIKKVRLIATMVLPEFQRWGVGLVVLQRMVPDVLDWGIETGEFSWVLESNKLSRGTLERGGAIRDKVFRIYDYPGDE